MQRQCSVVLLPKEENYLLLVVMFVKMVLNANESISQGLEVTWFLLRCASVFPLLAE